MPRASMAATAATRTADATVTRKSYAFGERHPSSVRPFRGMSHTTAQVFDVRSPNVCRCTLASHGRGACRCGIGIEVFTAWRHRSQAVVQVVAQRNPGRDVQADHVLVRHPVEI